MLSDQSGSFPLLSWAAIAYLSNLRPRSLRPAVAVEGCPSGLEMRMRAFLIALAVAAVSTTAHAEDMLLRNPLGIMCRDENSLADFSGNDGAVKKGVTDVFSSPAARRFGSACQSGGSPVHVVSKRRNTSIVTYEGQTWYVPNVAYMTPTPDCLREGAHVSFSGTVGTGMATFSADDERKYPYPRLVLDKPVCFIGNYADSAAMYMSLVPTTTKADFTRLMGMVGKRVTATGTLDTPDNIHKPPDLMLMYNPVITTDH